MRGYADIGPPIMDPQCWHQNSKLTPISKETGGRRKKGLNIYVAVYSGQLHFSVRNYSMPRINNITTTHLKYLSPLIQQKIILTSILGEKYSM